MLLNLRRDDFLLQALQNSFALRDRQADGSGRDPVRALDRGNLVFNLFIVNHFSDQLHCPFHPPSLPHPTTLHALLRQRVEAWPQIQRNTVFSAD
jgi:hypothetical protein